MATGGPSRECSVGRHPIHGRSACLCDVSGSTFLCACVPSLQHELLPYRPQGASEAHQSSLTPSCPGLEPRWLQGLGGWRSSRGTRRTGITGALADAACNSTPVLCATRPAGCAHAYSFRRTYFYMFQTRNLYASKTCSPISNMASAGCAQAGGAAAPSGENGASHA